jgi:hypothetical protein
MQENVEYVYNPNNNKISLSIHALAEVLWPMSMKSV